MNFQQILERESREPGLYYRRIDEGEWHWLLRFDPNEAGRLKQFKLLQKDEEDVIVEIIGTDLYHHDLYCGEWGVFVPRTPHEIAA